MISNTLLLDVTHLLELKLLNEDTYSTISFTQKMKIQMKGVYNFLWEKVV